MDSIETMLIGLISFISKDMIFGRNNETIKQYAPRIKYKLPKALYEFIKSNLAKANLKTITKTVNKIAVNKLICNELRPNKACLDKIHINAIKKKHK